MHGYGQRSMGEGEMYGYLTLVHTMLGGMQEVTLYLEQNYF